MKEITDKNFNMTVARGYSVVDVWAAWCGPCKRLTPLLEGLEVEFKDRVNFFSLDFDSNPKIPESYSVMSIPTLLFFEDGFLINQTSGLKSRIILEELITETFSL